jgi:ATP-dependent RNA helicase DeaD
LKTIQNTKITHEGEKMTFESMKLKPEILKAVKEMGFTKPTNIQLRCIPPLLEGKDLIGQSLTGSGKTAAFGLPLINKIIPGKPTQMLVLTPTRELAHQVKDQLELFGKYLGIRATSIFGGVGYEQQIRNMQYSEIIVATPGRLLDHLKQRTANISTVSYVVLDEADRMFDMGFERDVDRILQMTPKNRQTILFSATMPPAAKKIASKYLKEPTHIQEELHVDKGLLKEIAYEIPKAKKFSLLVHLLKLNKGTAIIFCRTKREVDRLSKNVRKQGFLVGTIHGDIPQNKRQKTMDLFKEGAMDILIATDVAARGIDIKNVSQIYNYDVPREPEDYTHRIGRTARAGTSGEAITLVTEYDAREFYRIVRNSNIVEQETPKFEFIEMEKFNNKENNDFGRMGERRGFNGGNRRSFSSRDKFSNFSSKKFGNETNFNSQSSVYGSREFRPRRFEGNRTSVSTFGNSSYGGTKNFESRRDGSSYENSRENTSYRNSRDGSGSRDFRPRREDSSYGNSRDFKPRFNRERSFAPRRENSNYGVSSYGSRNGSNYGNSREGSSYGSREGNSSYGSRDFRPRSFGNKPNFGRHEGGSSYGGGNSYGGGRSFGPRREGNGSFSPRRNEGSSFIPRTSESSSSSTRDSASGINLDVVRENFQNDKPLFQSIDTASIGKRKPRKSFGGEPSTGEQKSYAEYSQTSKEHTRGTERGEGHKKSFKSKRKSRSGGESFNSSRFDKSEKVHIKKK